MCYILFFLYIYFLFVSNNKKYTIKQNKKNKLINTCKDIPSVMNALSLEIYKNVEFNYLTKIKNYF